MTFIAFIVCGIVPLLVYLTSQMHQNSDVTFGISCAMTAGALFLLGALKVRKYGSVLSTIIHDPLLLKINICLE